MYFKMQVFKPTGKFYAEETINIDVSSCHCWELKTKIWAKEINVGYNDMFRVFTPNYDGHDPELVLYAVPFMVPPKE